MSKILLLHADHKESTRFQETVSRWGFDCTVVTTAADAFAHLEAAGSAGIVVLDLSTMRLDAPEINARLGRLQVERPLQVLVVTEGPVEDARKAFPSITGSMKPDDVLQKPLEARFLRGKLRAAERMLHLQVELAQAAQALRFFASHDSLTSLTQRQTAVEMLKQETQRSLRTHAPLSLLLLDLDGFHKLNGSLGYEAGDAALREVGMRLRHSMRGYDYASRYGNDEFLVLLPECNLGDAARLAVRLQNEVFGPRFPLQPAGAAQPTGLSACIAVTESYGRTPSAVLAELEAALRVAKTKGTSTVECAQDAGAPALPSTAELPRGRVQARFSFDDSSFDDSSFDESATSGTMIQ